MFERFVFLVACCAVVDARAAGVRVFVAPLATGAGADRAVVALFDDRLLASARDHRSSFDVIGGRDVQSILDVEATRQAAGCSGEMSCAVEVAGALDAPQIVSGQLGRVGDTWVLSLTRTERATLSVLARVVRESHGDSPEGLLPTVNGAVDELFSEGGPSPWLVGGGIGLGVGVALGAVGAYAATLSLQTFEDAKSALGAPDVQDAEGIRSKAQEDGSNTNNIAVGCWIAGAIIGAVSVVVVGVDLIAGGE